jgi:hypothetical protein
MFDAMGGSLSSIYLPMVIAGRAFILAVEHSSFGFGSGEFCYGRISTCVGRVSVTQSASGAVCLFGDEIFHSSCVIRIDEFESSCSSWHLHRSNRLMRC